MNPCLCTGNRHSRVISGTTKRKNSLSKSSPCSTIISRLAYSVCYDWSMVVTEMIITILTRLHSYKLHLFAYLSYDWFLQSLNKLTWLLSIGRLQRWSHNSKALQVSFCFVVRAKKTTDIKPKLEFACRNRIRAVCKHTRSFLIKLQPLHIHVNSFQML